MDFYLEKELKNKPADIWSLQLGHIRMRNPKSHTLLKNDEIVETSVNLGDCFYRPVSIENMDCYYPNFHKLLQTYNLHTAIYPNNENQKDVSCSIEIKYWNTLYLRIFLTKSDYTNFLILMGSSQVVTFGVSCITGEDLEPRAKKIFESPLVLNEDEREKKAKLEFSFDVDKLDISFQG